MIRLRTISVIALLIAIFSSCKSEYEALLMSNDIDAKYAAAMDYFNNKKYRKAAELFESMAVLTNGTARDDTVQYYWGLSNYRYRDYYTAQSNFTRFLENFPRSPFAGDAQFYRLDCMYRGTYRYELDQAPSRACIAAINQYVREYNPDPGKLEACNRMTADLQDRIDRKAFEAAKQYYTMEDYLAAHVALKNVLKDNADNGYREEVLYYTAMSSYHYARLSMPAKQRERYLVFIDDYLNFIGENPDSDHRRELDPLYQKVQRLLGRDGSEPAPAE